MVTHESAELRAKTYDDALKALGGLISGKKRGGGDTWEHAYDGMRVFLERLNLANSMHELKVVHVAGTKGKGSTCAMVDCILRQAGYKTGLFTSPHLVDVRERIRLNGRPVSKDVFLEHFWWCHARLQEKSDSEYGMAAYFRFLTLLAMRLFLEQKVDVAIMEVGLGGRLDATNCIRSPVVCGVASLGFDHMDVLGNTLPEIAREKAGIFKPGVPAYTVSQPPDALQAMQEVAERITTVLAEVPLLQQRFPNSKQLHMKLGGTHQLQNASLAVELAAAWEAGAGQHLPGHQEAAAARLEQLARNVLPDAYLQGIQSCEWPGRSQVVQANAGDESDRLTYYLDGAHTPESMATCAHWFADVSKAGADVAAQPGHSADGDLQRVLVFNCQQERNPESLLRPLYATLKQRQALPDQALFVVPDSSYASLAKAAATGVRDTSWQSHLASVWQAEASQDDNQGTTSQSTVPLPVRSLPTLGGQRSAVLPSLTETIKLLHRAVQDRPQRRVQVLVTGSLYIVGDMLRLLGRTPV
mmetsp:Transcript_16300/g.48880  ORF Transcript_16300/g.48880 Transcript_16300/m.48880 type:complete len:528 (+) Transcript_16300:164-1747(+)